MKNPLFIALALISMLIGTVSARADTDQIRKSIVEKMPNVQIRSINKSVVEGLYEVVVNGNNVFYTDSKGETGVFGKMVDLRTRTDMTEKRVQELMFVDFSSLPLDKAILTQRGDGSRKLAVFSDPDCPYCKQLEKDLESISNISIYTFLMPLQSIHPDAMRKAELIWCSPDRARAYRDWMLDGVLTNGSRECDTPMRDILGLSKAMWLQGTPAMIFANGKLVPGAIQRHQIEVMLDATKGTSLNAAQ